MSKAAEDLLEQHRQAVIHGWEWLERLTWRKLTELYTGRAYQLREPIE